MQRIVVCSNKNSVSRKKRKEEKIKQWHKQERSEEDTIESNAMALISTDVAYAFRSRICNT